jgi:hypothetical protein
MTHQSYAKHARIPIDAGRQIGQLRHVLALVDELAGRGPGRGGIDGALEESAQVSTIYWNALPIVQRRFDTLAGETAAWSAAGVEALLGAGEERSRAAAARLADELQKALADLLKMLSR